MISDASMTRAGSIPVFATGPALILVGALMMVRILNESAGTTALKTICSLVANFCQMQLINKLLPKLRNLKILKSRIYVENRILELWVESGTETIIETC